MITRYVNQVTNTIHLIEDIRKEFPNSSIPNDANCSMFGYEKLVLTQSPRSTEWEDVVEQPPVNNIQTWTVIPWPKEKIIQHCEALVEKMLDDFARTKGYDDIKSAIGYAGCSVEKYSVEGTYCKNARAEIWFAFYEIINISIPKTFEDLKQHLPKLEWPR